MIRIFIGYDEGEKIAFHVLSESIRRLSSEPVSIVPLDLNTIKNLDNISKENGNNAGFMFKSYSIQHDYTADAFLNNFALHVKDICTKQSKKKIGEIIRIYWNMYVPSSKMDYHLDMPKGNNCVSIIYNLHSNDGGTDFKNNKIVKSKEGQAIVFNSDSLHKGISSKIIPVRYALNIVCKEND